MAKPDASGNVEPHDDSYNADAIPTPADQQDRAATDPIAGVVEDIMDNVQGTFDGRTKDERKRS